MREKVARLAPYIALAVSLAALTVVTVLYVRTVVQANTWCYEPDTGEPVTLNVRWRPWQGRSLKDAVWSALDDQAALGETEGEFTLTTGACPEDRP